MGAKGMNAINNMRPRQYAGGQSVTLPNGLVVKFGFTAVAAGIATVTFDDAFDTAIIAALATAYEPKDPNGANTRWVAEITARSTTAINLAVQNVGTITGCYWLAIGY